MHLFILTIIIIISKTLLMTFSHNDSVVVKVILKFYEMR